MEMVSRVRLMLSNALAATLKIIAMVLVLTYK